MKKLLLFLSFFILTVSTVLAKDYFSLWSSSSEAINAEYIGGFIQGMSMSQTIDELQQEPESSWDAKQRLVMQVYKNVSKVDGRAATRVISDFYADPANAQIHMTFLFFPAAARLLGVPEHEIAEALRLLRQSFSK